MLYALLIHYDVIMARSGTANPARRAGFELLGEPLAIDLANTVKLAVNPAKELLVDEDAHAAFWSLEAERLPVHAAPPSPATTLALRAAVRDVLEAARTASPPDPEQLRVVNETAALATMTLQLDPDGTAVEHWTAATPRDATLAAVARSAIAVAAGPQSDRLRQCAAPTCSMLFIAANAKRVWCTPDGCGNRQRVARFTRARNA